jgi:hypothetical protein
LSITNHIQWLNDNEGRAYPVAETATQLDNRGTGLPMDLVVDLCLMLPPEHQQAYISSLRVTEQAILIGISSPASGLFIGTYRRSDMSPYTAHPLTPLLPNITGWVSFGNYIPSGVTDLRFDGPEQSQVEARAIRLVDPLPIKRFIKFGSPGQAGADQIVTFRGAGGIVFEVDPENGQNVICRLDEDYKEQYIGPCNSWAHRDICGAPPLRSFNGVCPDENGRITLRFE